jgi:hypothetical protein
MEKYLEYRMYFFVNRSLSPIQKGIQAGHAALELVKDNFELNGIQSFLNRDKTWIILDGGTSNESMNYVGSMEDIQTELLENNAIFASFYEPDLNDCLTAISLLVDERVFNKEYTSNFKDYLYDIYEKESSEDVFFLSYLDALSHDELIAKFYGDYLAFEDYLGGKTNMFLKDYLSQFRLAN